MWNLKYQQRNLKNKNEIDHQPTAFDVDKVVDQLEETKGIYSELSLIFRDNTKIEKYIGMEQAIALALEIVKESEVEQYLRKIKICKRFMVLAWLLCLYTAMGKRT